MSNIAIPSNQQSLLVTPVDGSGTVISTSTLALEGGGNLAAINTKLGEVQASPTTNTVLARLKSIADAINPPTNFTVTTVCLTTALVESSISLTSAKKIACYSRTNTIFRLSTTSGNTINTQNFEIVLNGNEYYQDGINFTGTLYFSAETLPTPVTVANCTTTSGSPTVTSSNSFSSAVIGQAVSGTGIPANTFIIRRAADGLSITLGDASGNTVNATASGTVTLTFSGAVIRISRWT